MQRFICTNVVLFFSWQGIHSGTPPHYQPAFVRQVGDRQSSPGARQNSILVPLFFCPSSVKTVTSAQSSGCSSLPSTCHSHFSTGTARCSSWPRIQHLLSNRPPTCSLVQDCGLVTPYYNHFNLQPDPDLLSDIGGQLCRLFLLGLSLLQ
jgi:hypothetical protein